MSDKKKLVVIGNGMVGHKFLQSMVNNEALQDYEVTTFCEETRLAYDRVQLSSYFSGQSEEDLSLVEPGFFEKNNITVHVGDRASSIDREAKKVLSNNGQSIPYDKLVLATGSFPFVPPIPGHERENCFVYRTIDDLIDIKKAGEKSKVGVVIGGGLLGLEAAKALKDLGLKTHVVEFAPRLMAVQIDDGAGEVLRKKIEDLGVSVHTQKNTQAIVDGEQCLHRMNFADGTFIETDVILFSAGIRPRDDIARDCGLTLGERGGVVINDHCQTSDEDIYAIGECALWDGKIFGLVAPGYQMAQVVADQLSAKENSFTGADMSTKLKLMGVDVASIGDAHAVTENSKVYTYVNGSDEVYKKIVVSEDKKHLLGAVLIGDAVDYGNLLQMKLNDIALPEHPDSLILPQRDGSGSTGLGVEALPDTAQICSCYDVSKGALCQAVADGATTMAALKECTSATTGCGGCTALVGQVLNKELEKLGMDVNTDLCEHFAYTRQDLYNLIRVNEIKTFDEMLEKYGKGYGCDLC
ncbi:MAG TPA: nitrite reductase (NAD(P)H), partial [Methylococcaceae bacterium]|nr:nitrite reductase (NAD(P)H) [Methylococcaceae bacterium]